MIGEESVEFIACEFIGIHFLFPFLSRIKTAASTVGTADVIASDYAVLATFFDLNALAGFFCPARLFFSAAIRSMTGARR